MAKLKMKDPVSPEKVGTFILDAMAVKKLKKCPACGSTNTIPRKKDNARWCRVCQYEWKCK